MLQRLKRIKKNVSLYGLIVEKKFEQFLDDSKKSEKLPTICQLCQQNAYVTLFFFVQIYMNQFYLSGMSPVPVAQCPFDMRIILFEIVKIFINNFFLTFLFVEVKIILS